MSDKYIINSSTLTGIADAIREKTGSSDAFTPSQMISAINNISTGATAIKPFQYLASTITEYSGSEGYIFTQAFSSCSSLTNVSFPNCVYIDSAAFYKCKSLASIEFPECTFIGSSAFSGCNLISVASFPVCEYIKVNAFLGCASLVSLYLDKVSSVTKLASPNAFNNTPLSAGGSGKIYVPSSLLGDFFGDSYWSNVRNRLVGV